MNWKLFFALMLLCKAAFGDSNPPLTKIIIRYIAPDLPEISAAAKPKKIHLAGNRFARIEQESDGGFRSASLVIVNEPDIWLIDVASKSGKHSVNPGPDLSVHNPILGADSPDELFDFEFGREIEFLNTVGAKSLDSKQIRDRKCETREFVVGDYLVMMYLDAKSKSPVELKAFKNGKMIFTIDYLSYQRGLPFDASLFEPPKGINFTEQTDRR